MPKQLRDIRKFLSLAKSSSCKKVIVFSSRKNKVTKFKIRTPKILYTLKIKNPQLINKIKETLESPRMYINIIQNTFFFYYYFCHVFNTFLKHFNYFLDIFIFTFFLAIFNNF